MLDDHREAAYQVMQTIALKQGIDRIRMFNSAGHVTFSTNQEDRQESPRSAEADRQGARQRLPRGRRLAPAGHAHADLQRDAPAARRNATRIRPASRRWACWTCR
jgi:hypothetical protein